jgi:negative regulator of sigma E activity
MNEALKMQISAFVDGELPDNESELLLRRLSQDASMRQQVAEYLEIGRLIRRDPEVAGIAALRGRISTAIGDEQLPESESNPAVGSRFISPASGVAIAATVAVVALLGLNQLGAPVDSGVQEAVAIDLAPAYTEPSLEQVLTNSPSERQLDYLRRHGDSSPAIGSSDIIYRMATFEISENLEVIEPDGHLARSRSEADVGAGGADSQSLPR